MSGVKGQKSGRKVGQINRFTAVAKDAFEFAFLKMGGPRALADWAAENQTDFYKLFARLLPTQVAATVKRIRDEDDISDEQLAIIAAGGSVDFGDGPTERLQ